jgi:hypothetical protein
MQLKVDVWIVIMTQHVKVVPAGTAISFAEACRQLFTL